MIVFVCVDDRDGMMFNGRRLSQDRKLREAVLETASPGRLWMNEYSRGQFPQEASICVSRDFLSLAQEKDFCFVEDQDLSAFSGRISKIILFHWNRSYPADFYFDRSLLEGRSLVYSEEFKGFSHEKITREDYV